MSPPGWLPRDSQSPTWAWQLSVWCHSIEQPARTDTAPMLEKDPKTPWVPRVHSQISRLWSCSGGSPRRDWGSQDSRGALRSSNNSSGQSSAEVFPCVQDLPKSSSGYGHACWGPRVSVQAPCLSRQSENYASTQSSRLSELLTPRGGQ